MTPAPPKGSTIAYRPATVLDGARLSALVIVALVGLHTAQLYGAAFYPSAESPLWFNSMIYAQRLLDLPIAASRPRVGAVFAGAGVVIAVMLWQRRSLTLAAIGGLLWAVLAGWDMVHRMRQIAFQLGQGWLVGLPHDVGMITTTFAAALTVLIVAGLVARVGGTV